MNGDRGQASLEVVAAIPVLLVVAVLCLQLLAAGYAPTLADGAAEAGALALAGGVPAEPAVEAALPGWARDRFELDRDGGRLTIELRPPSPFRRSAARWRSARRRGCAGRGRGAADGRGPRLGATRRRAATGCRGGAVPSRQRTTGPRSSSSRSGPARGRGPTMLASESARAARAPRCATPASNARRAAGWPGCASTSTTGTSASRQRSRRAPTTARSPFCHRRSSLRPWRIRATPAARCCGPSCPLSVRWRRSPSPSFATAASRPGSAVAAWAALPPGARSRASTRAARRRVAPPVGRGLCAAPGARPSPGEPRRPAWPPSPARRCRWPSARSSSSFSARLRSRRSVARSLASLAPSAPRTWRRSRRRARCATTSTACSCRPGGPTARSTPSISTRPSTSPMRSAPPARRPSATGSIPGGCGSSSPIATRSRRCGCGRSRSAPSSSGAGRASIPVLTRAEAEAVPASSGDAGGGRRRSPPAAATPGRLEYRQGERMRPDVAAAFDRMAAAAAADGVSLLINDGFRSDAEQAALLAQNPDPQLGGAAGHLAAPLRDRARPRPAVGLRLAGGERRAIRLPSTLRLGGVALRLHGRARRRARRRATRSARRLGAVPRSRGPAMAPPARSACPRSCPPGFARRSRRPRGAGTSPGRCSPRS